MEIAVLVAFIVALALVYLTGRLLAMPVKVIGRLLLNGIVGGVVLLVINMVGSLFGCSIAVNAFTALIAGTLGLHGVVLLVLLRSILGA